MVYNPDDFPQLKQALQQHEGPVIACYCAAWCDSCNSYQNTFNTLAKALPSQPFVWVDIEDYPEFLGDVDIENFPTILIQQPHGTQFFGELPPHPAPLERLVNNLSDLPTEANHPIPSIWAVIKQLEKR